MAEKRTIDINIKNNADEAAKDFNHFNDALDETAKSAKNVNSTFEEVYGDLQPLTTRLGEAEDRLYELALAGDTTSKEYQELLEKVGQYRRVQIQTDQVVDGAAQTMNQKLGSALNGAASAFAATQGAMALFGSESEELEKTLLKVQAALAIQQGVKGLSDAYKELGGITGIVTGIQKAFNAVLRANPIVLIATGIAAAIAALVAFTSVLDPVIDKLKEFSDFIGLTNFAEEEREEARIKRAEAEIARINKLSALRKQRFEEEQNAFNRRIGLLQAEGKQTGVLEQLKELNAIKQAKRDIEYAKGQIQRLRLLKRRLDGQSDEAKELEKQIDDFSKAIRESNQQIADSNNQLKINVIEANKEKADSYREYRDTRLQIARQIEDLENELLEEGIEKELEINRDRFRRLREDAEGNAEEQARLRELYTEQELRAEQEIRQKYLDEEKNERLELLNFVDETNKAEVESEKAKNLAIVEASKKAYEEQKALDEKAAKEKAERQKAQIDLAVQGFQLIADFAESFAGDDEKRQKKAFQIKKAADIAAATVDGYRAVLSTYAQTPGGPVLKGIAAGIAGGFAALQIANIARQQFEGEGGGGDFSADTGGGAGEVITPEFNVVGDAGINQLAQLQQQPTQAYVVSGEVTSAQALDRNRVTNATL